MFNVDFHITSEQLLCFNELNRKGRKLVLPIAIPNTQRTGRSLKLHSKLFTSISFAYVNVLCPTNCFRVMKHIVKLEILKELQISHACFYECHAVDNDIRNWDRIKAAVITV